MAKYVKRSNHSEKSPHPNKNGGSLETTSAGEEVERREGVSIRSAIWKAVWRVLKRLK